MTLLKVKLGLCAMLVMLAFSACTPDDTPKEIEGWKPVYESEVSDAQIKSEEPRAIQKGGKIYVLGNTLYQVEEGKGIHVLNFSDPANPQRIAFITLGGAHEISIKGQYLYSNNYDDLVIIDIADIANVKLEKRMKDLFRFTNSEVPPERGYFECVDPNKGKVVDWEQTTIYSPKCKY